MALAQTANMLRRFGVRLGDGVSSTGAAKAALERRRLGGINSLYNSRFSLGNIIAKNESHFKRPIWRVFSVTPISV